MRAEVDALRDEVLHRWNTDAEFHARVHRAAQIAHTPGARMGDLRMGAAVALVLEERADPEGPALSGSTISGEQPAASVGEHGPDAP